MTRLVGKFEKKNKQQVILLAVEFVADNFVEYKNNKSLLNLVTIFCLKIPTDFTKMHHGSYCQYGLLPFPSITFTRITVESLSSSY